MRLFEMAGDIRTEAELFCIWKAAQSVWPVETPHTGKIQIDPASFFYDGMIHDGDSCEILFVDIGSRINESLQSGRGTAVHNKRQVFAAETADEVRKKVCFDDIQPGDFAWPFKDIQKNGHLFLLLEAVQRDHDIKRGKAFVGQPANDRTERLLQLKSVITGRPVYGDSGVVSQGNAFRSTGYLYLDKRGEPAKPDPAALERYLSGFWPFLRRQIRILGPRYIICLGNYDLVMKWLVRECELGPDCCVLPAGPLSPRSEASRSIPAYRKQFEEAFRSVKHT